MLYHYIPHHTSILFLQLVPACKVFEANWRRGKEAALCYTCMHTVHGLEHQGRMQHAALPSTRRHAASAAAQEDGSLARRGSGSRGAVAVRRRRGRGGGGQGW